MTEKEFVNLSQENALDFLSKHKPVAKRERTDHSVLLYRFPGFWVEVISDGEQTILSWPNGSVEEDEFNEVFFKYGGLELTRLIKGIDKYADIRESSNSIINIVGGQHRLPPIYFDFIDSPVFNAAVTKFNNRLFIGLNAGAYYLVFDLFTKIFSSKRLLPHIGSTELEVDADLELNRHYNEGIAFDVQASKFFFPKDALRSHYARHYAQRAIDFLVLHEIGHIVRGHVGYLASQTNEFAWSEIDYTNKSKNKIHPSVSQVFEFDADSFAAFTIFTVTQNAISRVSTAPEIQKRFYADIVTFLQDWIFSIYCLFRLFNFKTLDLDQAKLSSHPPASVRIVAILSTLERLLTAYKTENVKDIMNRLNLTIEQAEEAFASLTYNQNSLDVFNANLKLSYDFLEYIEKNKEHAHALVTPFLYPFHLIV